LTFLKNNNLSINEVSAMIAHPGGRKVLEEMEKAIGIERNLLRYSYNVLAHHGNMSSATVVYVLKKWLQESIKKSFSKELGILSALGPGFSSELLWIEWANE